MGPWTQQQGSIGISWTFFKNFQLYSTKKMTIFLPAFQAVAQAAGSGLLKIQAGPKAVSG